MVGSSSSADASMTSLIKVKTAAVYSFPSNVINGEDIAILESIVMNVSALVDVNRFKR